MNAKIIFIGETKERKLVKMLEDLIEIVWDSKLAFETKHKYIKDLAYGFNKTLELIETMRLDEALTNLLTLRSHLSLRIEFNSKISNLVNKIEDLL